MYWKIGGRKCKITLLGCVFMLFLKSAIFIANHVKFMIFKVYIWSS